MGRLKPPDMKPFKVLFVCVGNAIRSQMAEGFARKYGSDIMVASSCGIAPAVSVMPQTRVVMAQRGIDLGDAYPKSLESMESEVFDYIINMSGAPLRIRGEMILRDWNVPDPMGLNDERYIETAQRIENMVMQIILELRGKRRHDTPAAQMVPSAFRSPRRMPG